MARDGLTVFVEVERLLTTLEQNKATHGAAYQKAKAGWLKVSETKLLDLLQKVSTGELNERVWLDNPPDDHTDDYTDAIEMLGWSQESTIELTQAQFKQYVLDQWGWKDSWLTSNTAYLQA